MSSAALHLPLDFGLREGVRLLAKRLAEASCADADLLAELYVFRLWCDYGRASSEWRALTGPYTESYSWASCDLCGLLESFCGWRGERGALIRAMLGAGVLKLEQRGDVFGLALAGFLAFNEHLMPGYRSQHSKGGHAKAAKNRLRDLHVAAEQQTRIEFTGGKLLFDDPKPPSMDESKAAKLLVMRIDTEAGRTLRTIKEYEEDRTLLGEALRIVRTYTEAERDLVLDFVRENRDNCTISKDAAVVLRDFKSYLEMAR